MQDIGDIPVHLLSLNPSWFTKKRMYQRIINRNLKVLCPKSSDSNYNDKRRIECYRENREKYLIGSKALKPKYNLKFTKSKIFNRKSKSYRIKVKSNYIENMHPGINGAGAINEISKIYTPYRSMAWLINYLETNLNTNNNDNNDKNNIELNTFPILHYSEYDTSKCGVVCENDFKQYLNNNPYPFNVEYARFSTMAPTERLGMVKMEFTDKFVHSLGLNDANIPNLIEKEKNIKLKLKLDRLCGFGGPCYNKYRSLFGSGDGWDLFYGEQIQFQLNILSNSDHFNIIIYQNPIITKLIGSNTVLLGKGMRKKQIVIKPKTNEIQYGIKYKFQYDLVSNYGDWHRFYLYYSKLFEAEKSEYLQNHQSQSSSKSNVDSNGCKISNKYSPKRPELLGCNFDNNRLKLHYTQDWIVQLPKPGKFKHDLTTQFKMNSINIAETKCGLIEAKLENWPKNGNEHYIKLLLKYIGNEGGIIFVDNDDDSASNILRFPEKKEFGEINIPFRKYKKKWCIEAKAPGAYIMTFEPYGSLLKLFPNPPSQIYINVKQGRKFKITISNELNGQTVFNNQWSDLYEIRISQFPSKDKQETDILVTPKQDLIQFSPSKFIFSPNTEISQRKRRKKFKFRPLLDCAFGGIEINIEWEVTGMIGRVIPYPIMPTKLKVIEHIKSDGCDQESDKNIEDEEFIPIEIDKINTENIDTNITKKQTNDENDIKPKQPKESQIAITFVVALILLCCFGLIIIILCIFGCLGNDKEFELLVATQIKDAIINKQKQMLIAKMNNSANDNIIQTHYERNMNARQRLIQQNHTFPS